MAPVILETDVHCFGCAMTIRRTIVSLPGVERVWAFPDTGLVVVAGTADAEVLRRRIQHKMRRVVTVVSDGTGDHRYGTTQHPRYYTWATTTSHPQPVAYPYGGNYYRAAYPRRHVSNSNGTPTYLDDEIPDEYCCSIQ